MLRVLTMAGGIAGAVAVSQFPEFSQQYMQRLSGAVNELRVVATAFDLTASAAGLTRDEALAQIQGSEFEDGLRENMATSLARYDRLSADYAALAERTPLERLARLWHFRDVELASRTWDSFRPAVPVTTDGLVFAGIGFAAGWALVWAVLSALGLFARRLFRLA